MGEKMISTRWAPTCYKLILDCLGSAFWSQHVIFETTDSAEHVAAQYVFQVLLLHQKMEKQYVTSLPISGQQTIETRPHAFRTIHRIDGYKL